MSPAPNAPSSAPQGPDDTVVTLSDVAIPRVGLGTWQLRGTTCREMVVEALAVGYRHVDTAQRYDNERDVGAGLARSAVPRDRIFLTTKIDRAHREPADLRTSVEESLRALGTDHVDLLLQHWPSPTVPVEEMVGGMQELVDAGVVRHLGVSNFPPSLLERASATARVVTDQVEYHPYLAQDALLQSCRDHDMALTAYSPLARGLLLEDPVLVTIARAHGRTTAQVALRWLVQQPGVVVIPRSSDPAHLRDNLAILDFHLAGDEMERLSGLARGHRGTDPAHAPDWERD